MANDRVKNGSLKLEYQLKDFPQTEIELYRKSSTIDKRRLSIKWRKEDLAIRLNNTNQWLTAQITDNRLAFYLTKQHILIVDSNFTLIDSIVISPDDFISDMGSSHDFWYVTTANHDVYFYEKSDSLQLINKWSPKDYLPTSFMKDRYSF